MSSRQIASFWTEILPLPLVHERLFLARPVILALVLGRRSVGSMDAVMAVVSIAVAVLAVMAIVPVRTVMAIYVLDPLLILHFDPPYSKRASLLAGRAYRAPPGAGQARNNGSPLFGKIGGLWATGRAHFGDLDRQPGSRSRPAPNRAGRRRSCRKGRPWPTSAAAGREAKRAAEDLDLEFVEGVEGGSAALHRAAAPLRRVILTCRAISASMPPMVAERSGRLRRFRSVASSTEKPPAAARRGRGRVRDLDGGVRSGDAHDLSLGDGTRKRPGVLPKVARYG